jgi:hypothetical protein
MDHYVAVQVEKRLKQKEKERIELLDNNDSKVTTKFSNFGHQEAPSSVFASGRSESAVVWWKPPNALKDEEILGFEIHRYRQDDRGNWLHKGFTAVPNPKLDVFVIENLANDRMYRRVLSC